MSEKLLTPFGVFKLLSQVARLLGLRLGLASLIAGFSAKGGDLLLELLSLLVLLTLEK